MTVDGRTTASGRPGRVVGCMTGTSIDGLDAALIEIDGAGLDMRPRFIRGVSRPFAANHAALKDALRALADQSPLTARDIARLMLEFANFHADAIEALLAGETCDLVCVHGQTVIHTPPLSWQLMQPAPIARRVRAPVVFDLRQADLAAGGQGAPITPIGDWVWFNGLAAEHSGVAVVNLGGFCNVTRVNAGRDAGGVPRAHGFDLCPCNQLLDALARSLLRRDFDEDGREAARGNVHEESLEDLLGVMVALAKPGRSLGTGDEALEWISRWRAHVSPQDLAATTCDAIAERIGDATREASLVLLAGGGTRHRRLVAAIGSACAASVRTTSDFGLPSEYREAALFGVLGALCQDRVPITVRMGHQRRPEFGPVAGAWVLP